MHKLGKNEFYMYFPYVVFSFPTSHQPPSSCMYYTPLRVPTYFQKQDSLILVFPYSKLIHHFCVFSLWTCPLCLAFFYFLRYIYSYNLRNLNTNWYMKDTYQVLKKLAPSLLYFVFFASHLKYYTSIIKSASFFCLKYFTSCV